jgi:hypothetical protein
MRTITPICGLLLMLSMDGSYAQEPVSLPRTPAPAGATVYFRGMGVAPAGVQAPNTGHHHLLIDVDTPPPEGMPLPADEHVRHFGLGQTEAEIMLPPGQHTLQLVLGDAAHIPHQPPVRSEKITITVAP